MPTAYKVLGQVNPSATTATTLYTVGAGKSAVVSTITVCNQAASAATFTITMDGVAVISGASIAANSSAFFDLKQVLATTKVIAGLASAVTVNFHISGVEIA